MANNLDTRICIKAESLEDPCTDIAFPTWELTNTLLGGLKLSLEHYLPQALLGYEKCQGGDLESIGKGQVAFLNPEDSKLPYVIIELGNEIHQIKGAETQPRTDEYELVFIITVVNPELHPATETEECEYINLRSYTNAVLKVLALLRKPDLWVIGSQANLTNLTLPISFTVENNERENATKISFRIKAQEKSEVVFR